jgi:hypothetical protein
MINLMFFINKSHIGLHLEFYKLNVNLANMNINVFSNYNLINSTRNRKVKLRCFTCFFKI